MKYFKLFDDFNTSEIEIGDIINKEEAKDELFKVIEIGNFYELIEKLETEKKFYFDLNGKLKSSHKFIVENYKGPWAIIQLINPNSEKTEFFIDPLFAYFPMDNYFPYKLVSKKMKQNNFDDINKIGIL